MKRLKDYDKIKEIFENFIMPQKSLLINLGYKQGLQEESDVEEAYQATIAKVFDLEPQKFIAGYLEYFDLPELDQKKREMVYHKLENNMLALFTKYFKWTCKGLLKEMNTKKLNTQSLEDLVETSPEEVQDFFSLCEVFAYYLLHIEFDLDQCLSGDYEYTITLFTELCRLAGLNTQETDFIIFRYNNPTKKDYEFDDSLPSWQISRLKNKTKIKLEIFLGVIPVDLFRFVEKLSRQFPQLDEHTTSELLNWLKVTSFDQIDHLIDHMNRIKAIKMSEIKRTQFKKFVEHL